MLIKAIGFKAIVSAQTVFKSKQYAGRSPAKKAAAGNPATANQTN